MATLVSFFLRSSLKAPVKAQLLPSMGGRCYTTIGQMSLLSPMNLILFKRTIARFEQACSARGPNEQAKVSAGLRAVQNEQPNERQCSSSPPFKGVNLNGLNKRVKARDSPAFFTRSVLCFIMFYSALLQTNIIRFKWHGRTPKHCWRNKVGQW